MGLGWVNIDITFLGIPFCDFLWKNKCEAFFYTNISSLSDPIMMLEERNMELVNALQMPRVILEGKSIKMCTHCCKWFWFKNYRKHKSDIMVGEEVKFWENICTTCHVFQLCTDNFSWGCAKLLLTQHVILRAEITYQNNFFKSFYLYLVVTLNTISMLISIMYNYVFNMICKLYLLFIIYL